MGKKTLYVIYRIGSNAANQSFCHSCAVGQIESETREAATDSFRSQYPTCTVYPNQFLRAVPYSRCPAADRREIDEVQASLEADEQYFASLGNQ